MIFGLCDLCTRQPCACGTARSLSMTRPPHLAREIPEKVWRTCRQDARNTISSIRHRQVNWTKWIAVPWLYSLLDCASSCARNLPRGRKLFYICMDGHVPTCDVSPHQHARHLWLASSRENSPHHTVFDMIMISGRPITQYL